MKTHNPLFLMFANLAKKQIKEIDIHEAKSKLEQANPPFLVDVREDHEWQNGHLPHAIHLCKGVIERDIEKIIPDYQAPVLFYCSGGFRSAIAAKSIQEMGYKNVMSMEGGSSAWINAGFPMMKD
jgi:rhodanese-related sulfurtransferase